MTATYYFATVDGAIVEAGSSTGEPPAVFVDGKRLQLVKDQAAGEKTAHGQDAEHTDAVAASLAATVAADVAREKDQSAGRQALAEKLGVPVELLDAALGTTALATTATKRKRGT